MLKKLLRLSLCLALGFIGLTPQAKASHQMGNDLTYACVAPNVYVVTLKFYRDCSGIPEAASYTLNIKSPGCNTGRNITLNKLGPGRIGTPYCPSSPVSCNSTGLPNYQEFIYQNTLVFSAAEQACTDWTLAVNFTDGNRPTTANVIGAPVLYTEAFLKLDNSINNSSPQFDPLNIPIPMANRFLPITISLSAQDQDGDSLGYKMVPSLSGPATSVTYGSYAGQIIYNHDSTRTAIVPAGNYSATFPLPSFYIDPALPNYSPAVPYFSLDSLTGNLKFTPSFYTPNSAPGQGLNKYNAAMQVTEYRKINGVMVKVGMVRRELLILVVDCGPNANPTVGSIVANGQTLGTNPMIRLRPGVTLNLQLASADADTSNILAITSNVRDVIPYAQLVQGSGNRPTSTITWTPTAADVRSLPYYFNVIVKDNACPVQGYHVETIGVRVSNSGSVTGLNKETETAGLFQVYPNPFSETVNFKFSTKKAQEIKIYNMLGQEVDKFKVASGQVDIRWEKAAAFAPGTYLARLFSADNSVQTLKFNKIR